MHKISKIINLSKLRLNLSDPVLVKETIHVHDFTPRKGMLEEEKIPALQEIETKRSSVSLYISND